MIDSHAHLHFPDFASDLLQVLTRSFAMGVTGIVEVAVGPHGWPDVLALAHADPRIHACLGIHPHEARAATPPALRELDRLIADRKVVALGETGLDRVRGFAPLEDQERAFVAQIGLARERRIPLVVHCREAFDELLPVLDREGRRLVRGVFHCFSGDLTQAQRVTGRGFCVGLGGAITYAPERWRPVLRVLPREAILLETDAPYLRPAPDRHGRNEPAFVFATAALIASLLEMEPAELERLADRNARRLFGIPEGRPPESAPRPDGAKAPSGSPPQPLRDGGAPPRG